MVALQPVDLYSVRGVLDSVELLTAAVNLSLRSEHWCQAEEMVDWMLAGAQNVSTGVLRISNNGIVMQDAAIFAFSTSSKKMTAFVEYSTSEDRLNWTAAVQHEPNALMLPASDELLCPGDDYCSNDGQYPMEQQS